MVLELNVGLLASIQIVWGASHHGGICETVFLLVPPVGSEILFSFGMETEQGAFVTSSVAGFPRYGCCYLFT